MKFWIAMSGYLFLAVLAWSSLSDPNVRWVTLAILLLLALKTVMHELRQRQAAREDKVLPM